MTTRPLPLLVALVALTGCDASSLQNTPTSVPRTPESVLDPRAPDEVEAKKSPTTATDADAPAEATPRAEPDEAGKPDASPSADVKLVPMKYQAFRKAVTRPDARLTVVDAWATWCVPCMENFPHLVAMHRKYADKGLACVSLSLDFPDDPKAFDGALKFLKEQGATFTNVLLDEEQGDAFDRLDLNGVPAVLIYDPSGKEIRRFVGDDPNRPFTYDQVEEVVVKLLNGEELPAGAPGEVRAGAE